jgi:hypothetical protein
MDAGMYTEGEYIKSWFPGTGGLTPGEIAGHAARH